MDGEYNKYPVYKGCIRFDDDNIYCVPPDIVETPKNIILFGTKTGDSMLTTRFQDYIFVNAASAIGGVNASTWLFDNTGTNFILKGFYFNNNNLSNNNNKYILRISNHAPLDIYLGRMDNVTNATIMFNITSDYPINVFYEGEMYSQLRTKLNMPETAIIHENAALPTMEEFLKLYGG